MHNWLGWRQMSRATLSTTTNGEWPVGKYDSSSLLLERPLNPKPIHHSHHELTSG